MKKSWYLTGFIDFMKNQILHKNYNKGTLGAKKRFWSIERENVKSWEKFEKF